MLGIITNKLSSSDICQKTEPTNQKNLELHRQFEPQTAKWTQITMGFIKSLPKASKENFQNICSYWQNLENITNITILF